MATLRVRLLLVWAVVFGGIPLTTGAAEGLTVDLRTEAGSFNTAYLDPTWVSPTWLTKASLYTAVGGEFRWVDPRRSVVGFNFGQTLVDPFGARADARTALGVFSGQDFGWWGLDLGVAALVHLRPFDAVRIVEADGSEALVTPAGWDWDRRESYTLVTASLRVLSERRFHLKVQVGRGPLSVTESLQQVVAVFPGRGDRTTVALSFSSPWAYWKRGPGVLRSNERLTLGWQTTTAQTRLGFEAGFLLRPMVAGTGQVDLVHRLNLAVTWGGTLTDRP